MAARQSSKLEEYVSSSLLYRNYYQLKYSWNFLKKVKWLSDIRQPFFDLLR